MRFSLIILSLFLLSPLKAQINLQRSLSYAEFHFEQLSDSNRKKLSEPQKAALFSAVLPGTGQIYNRKFWKAGIVYAGAVGLIYMFSNNRDSMNIYQEAYSSRIDGDPLTIDNTYPLLSDAAVKSNRDFHRRLRDMSILGFVGLYAIQIIDANVDAHLKEFKINKDLNVGFQPYLYQNLQFNQYNLGLSIRLRFQ